MLTTLEGTGEILTAVLSGAPATTQPNYHVLYKHGAAGNKSTQGVLTGSTSLAMLTGDEVKAEVAAVHIYNADTATVTVTLGKTSGGTNYPLVKEAVPSLGMLRWTPESGVEVITSTGAASSETVGAVVAGIGVVATESGNGPYRKTLLTLTNTPMTITDALAYAGLKLYDFPAGRIRVLDCVASLAFTTHSAIASTLNSGVTCSWGIGSATASNVTLATTMMNFLPGSAESVKSFTSSTTIDVAPATVTGFLAAVAAAQLAAILDGTGTAVDLYLNVSVPSATDIDANASLLVNGTIEITWLNGGDV